ncbi:MAG: hypothetical protein NTW55_00255 [Planctomycetota bacterium]|nr:hypothetical protein [Planctomycetota bacterium]
MDTKKSLEKQLEELGHAVSREDAFAANVMARINAAEPGRIKQNNKLIFRSFIMNRFTKFAAAAVIIIAVVLLANFWTKTSPTAAAAEVFSQAVKAMENLKSVYIKLQMRTLPSDNFELIGVNYDLVPIEMWKKFDGTFYGKWRAEKPGRVVVMDGNSTLLLIRPNEAAKGGPNTGFVMWLKDLLDIEKILDRQLELAKEQGSDLLLTHEQTQDGHNQLVVTVEAKAMGNFANDYAKNSSIWESDNQRIYRFDEQTKLLEGLDVYVRTDKGDVLVLQITEIKYNLDLDPALFVLELPADVIWLQEPQQSAGDEKYAQLSPKEVAAAFFDACAKENWNEALKFYPISTISQRTKDYLGGLEVISIGKPFKSGLYPGWFVPYEIKFKWGEIKKMNLTVRKDNKAKRYMVDGGW